MLPCKEIVRVLSSGEELPLAKRLELRLHLMMCKYCARFATHLQIMRKQFSRLFNEQTSVKEDSIRQLEKTVLDSLFGEKRPK